MALSIRKTILIVRYTGMVSLAFFLTHYLTRQQLPFTPDYQFPLQSFLIVLLFGLFICESNAFIYRYLKETRTYNHSLQQIIGKQFLWSAAATALVYTVLFLLINQGVFGRPFHFPGYAKYLLICIAIALFEDVLLTSWDMYQVFSGKTKADSLKNTVEKIVIKQGSNQIELNTRELALLRSEHGIVTITDQNLHDYTTHFNSLNELEEQLPPTDFFRINRQYFVHRNVIKAIQKDKNRKLRVVLEKPFLKKTLKEGLMVSRYKNVDFKKWYLSNS